MSAAAPPLFFKGGCWGESLGVCKPMHFDSIYFYTKNNDLSFSHLGRRWPSREDDEHQVGLMSEHGFEPHQCPLESVSFTELLNP